MSQALKRQVNAERVMRPLAKREALTRKESRDLHKRALYHYEKSVDAKTRNEQTVAHRGQAKQLATALNEDKASKALALNLLARIALDEGFYALAEQYLTEAIEIDSQDVGCWYSLGHVRLAQNEYPKALACFSKALDISPKETRAASSLAYTLAKQGRVVEAFQAYRNLFRVHPKDEHIRAKLFEIVRHIKADFYQADLENDVLTWLETTDTNHQNLAHLVISLLRHKYRFNEPDAVIDLQDLARDALLGQSLGKMYFSDNELEIFLRTIRKQVLLHTIASEYSDQALLTLAGNLAMNAEHNEHVYVYDNQERDILNAIRPLIESLLENTASFSLVDVAPLLVLYGMYEPLLPLTHIQSISKVERASWPKYSRSFIEHSVVNALSERQLAGTVKCLTDISDEVSKKVKQQYEENPYPRWLHLGYNTPTNYGRALEQELQGFRAPSFFNMGTVKVLIAGAGTGQHALKVARYFRNVEVVALDLSQRSLAYAKRMAKLHKIDNIKFLCGDILELDKLETHFHVIECSGVLHHMKEPELGLQKLISRLEPKGLIKIGLYSYRAREIVRDMRDLIQKYDMTPTPNGIRTLRQAILEGKMPHDFSGIFASDDFYSMSGCRDLLFHAQECQYEPKELKALVDQNNLQFLGFIIPETVRKDYLKEYPDDHRLIELDNWQSFEAKNPKLFAGMFQFYVQRKA